MKNEKIKYKVVSCTFCGANALVQTLEDCMSRIRNCNNCKIDITLNGTWSGIGAVIMQQLIKHHGLQKCERLYSAKR